MKLGHCNDTVKQIQAYQRGEWDGCFMQNRYFLSMASPSATYSLTSIEAMGIVCNTLILLAFKEMKYIRPSTLIWLYTIAVTNILYSCTQFIVFESLSYLQTFYFCSLFRAYLKIWPTLYWIHHWNQVVKLWSTVILAGERFVAIAYPFKIITLSSKKNSLITLMVLIVFSGIMTLPRLFEFNMKERPPIEIYSSSSKEDRHVNQCVLYNVTLLRLPNFIRDANISCHIVCGCKPDWNDQQLYRFWYHIVVEASVKFIFPFLLLLGFNVGIIRNLIHSYKFQKRMMRAKPQSQPDSKGKVNRWTSMTNRPSVKLWFVNISSLAIVLSFFLCRLPVVTRNLLIALDVALCLPPNKLMYTASPAVETAIKIIYMLEATIVPILLQASLNPCFRTALSDSFRKKVRDTEETVTMEMAVKKSISGRNESAQSVTDKD